MDAGIVHRSGRAFHAERWGRSSRSELIENRDGDRSKQNTVFAMFRKIVECNVGQPGPRAMFFGKLPEAIALADKRRSRGGLGAGVCPGAHVGDALRVFRPPAATLRLQGLSAPLRRAELEATFCVACFSSFLAVQAFARFQISLGVRSRFVRNRSMNRRIPRGRQATPVSPAQA